MRKRGEGTDVFLGKKKIPVYIPCFSPRLLLRSLLCMLRVGCARIQPADYTVAMGAFRSGNYKLIVNEVCSGWYTFDSAIRAEDPLTIDANVCDGHPCSSCGGETCGRYYDYLFDLEADPREEHNLIEVHPEVSTAVVSLMITTYVSYHARLMYVRNSLLRCRFFCHYCNSPAVVHAE